MGNGLTSKIIKCLLVSALLVICSCYNGRVPYGFPTRRNLVIDSPPGPENFKLGWQHGCQTGLGNSANRFYQPLFLFKKDFTLASKDADYSKGWGEAFWFCSRYGEIWVGDRSSGFM